jgi:AraC family transcriptional regulator
MTQWYELYGKEHEPSEEQIKEYVNTPLFDDLDSYLRQTYKVKPKIAYSSCSMDGGMWKGWNVKYQKSGKSLCTLYPKQGYLLLLVTIGVRGVNEAELLMPTCTEYIQSLWGQGEFQGSKYLGIELRDESVLCDVKSLIEIRAKTK